MKTKLLVLFSAIFILSNAPRALAQLGTESVTVSAPNGGECYIPGSEVTVTWSVSGVDHVAIGYRTDTNPPPTWQQDFQAWDAHPAFGTSFKWTVPNITSSTVKLWIEGHNSSHAKLAADSSNNTFSISNTCGVDTPASSGPQVTQVLIGSTALLPTDPIEVEKGTNVTLVGTAAANETITLYIKPEEKKLSVTADGDGKWTFDIFTSSLALGSHDVDLETSSSARAKALSFSIRDVGETPSNLPPAPSTPTTPLPSGGESAVERLTGGFPYIPVAIAVGIILVGGIIVYIVLKRRGKRLDVTPTEPPTIQ